MYFRVRLNCGTGRAALRGAVTHHSARDSEYQWNRCRYLIHVYRVDAVFYLVRPQDLLFRLDGLQFTEIAGHCFLASVIQCQSLLHDSIGISAGDDSVLLFWAYSSINFRLPARICFSFIW